MSKTHNTVSSLENLQINGWQWDSEIRDLVETMITPTVIQRDGEILVSAEDGKGLADYYGEFRGGYPYIHQALENWADALGYYWEWENPGAIALVQG